MPATTLEEWEHLIKPQLANVQLIGELELSLGETEQISRLIRNLIRSWGTEQATSKLICDYPCTFVTYLVFQGVYGYEGGDYWSSVCEATGLPPSPNYKTDWGHAFESIAERLGFRHDFPGHRYVGAILAHGGIPTTSLPDFFEHMLQPTVENQELSALSTRELIQGWLTGSARYWVDKPILRFLKEGGQVAVDFVERCRDMARETATSDTVPLATDVELPISVVATYEEWLEAPERFAPIPRTGPYIRKPVVRLDPWGVGVHVVLPEQKMPATQSTQEVTWMLSTDDKSQKIPVRVRRTDPELKTEATTIPIQRPASEYRVRFLVDGDCQREWTFKGLGENPDFPLLLFDADTGKWLARRDLLMSKPLWVLLPRQFEVEPKTVIRERLPQLPWDWSQWQAYELDLTDIPSLVLCSGDASVEIPVIASQQPSLVGGRCLFPDSTPPLYVGELPFLRIPHHQHTLSRWQIELRNEYAATPPLQLKTSLRSLTGICRRENGAIVLPLNHPELLGSRPLGQYRLRVRGPLSTGEEFRFCVVPELQMMGHDELYLPEAQQGAPVAHLLVETDAASHLEPLRRDSIVELKAITTDGDASFYEIVVPPDEIEAPVRLVRVSGTGETVSVPLQITIRRLRWALILDPVAPTWRHTPIVTNLDELEQSNDPHLIIDCPVEDEWDVSVQAGFYNAESKLLQLLEAPRSRHRPRFHRMDLREVRETLRHSRSPVIQAILFIRGLPDKDIFELPVLRIRRNIYVEHVAAEAEWSDDMVVLYFAWQPAIPLRSRQIRLWPLSRPWESPIAIPIPDDARNECIAEVLGRNIVAGDYLAEFLVEDPWAQQSKPTPDATNVSTVVLGSIERRLQELDAAIAREGEHFLNLFEQALLCQSLDDEAGVGEALCKCRDQLSTVPLDLVLMLINQFEDRSNAKAMLYELFRQASDVLEAFRSGELSEKRFNGYLDRLRCFVKSGLPISPKTSVALLDLPDDYIRLAAAQRLIEHSNPAGVDAVVNWLEQGDLASTDALGLLGQNACFSTELLADRPLNPTTMRLLDGLARAYPEDVGMPIIKPGHWIRCQAGWGRIERIESDRESDVGYARPGDLARGYRLHVTLRPTADVEPVVLDTSTGQVCFSQLEQRYMCTKCGQFLTRDQDLLISQHDSASHEGRNSAFRILNIDCLPQTSDFEFSTRPPTNICQ